MMMKMKPRVNFTNILQVAFEPVDSQWSYWWKVKSMKYHSWAKRLVEFTFRIGYSFVSETERRKIMAAGTFIVINMFSH